MRDEWFHAIGVGIHRACREHQEQGKRLVGIRVEVTEMMTDAVYSSSVVFEQRGQELVRCLVEQYTAPVQPFPAVWLTSDVYRLACAIREERDSVSLPILADALEEAGCNVRAVLEHCRQATDHGDHCWVVEHLLG